MKLITAAGVLAGLAIAGGASAQNLIVNGSFEDAGTTGHAAIAAPWVYTGVFGTDTTHPATIIQYNSTAGYPDGAFGEPIPTAPQIPGDPDAPGNYAAYFVADDATETLSQTVHLNPGVYTIGFSAYIPLNGYDNSGDASFSGTVAGQPLVTFDVHKSGAEVDQWQTWEQTLTIGAGQGGDYLTQFIYQSGPAPAADVVIDDVFIVAGNITPGIPEPASWALMLVGFGGLGAMLRRSRATAITA